LRPHVAARSVENGRGEPRSGEPSRRANLAVQAVMPVSPIMCRDEAAGEGVVGSGEKVRCRGGGRTYVRSGCGATPVRQSLRDWRHCGLRETQPFKLDPLASSPPVHESLPSPNCRETVFPGLIAG